MLGVHTTMSLLEQLGRRRFALRLPETAVATSDKRLSCSQLCTTHAHTASLGRNRIAPGLWSPQPKVPSTRQRGATRAVLPRTIPAVSSTTFPWGSGLSRQGPLRSLQMSLWLSESKQQFCIGSAATNDFPDSPGDGWATALAYREHVLRVVERLRKDPGAEVQVAEVDGRGRRLQAWSPGDESVRPSVLASIRAALGHQPQRKPGGPKVSTDPPEGSGLSRSQRRLFVCQRISEKSYRLGSAAAGDFPDRPEDGWVTALAYREHVLRVVERLREDPGAAVQVAEVDRRGRRLRAWAPGDESVRPSVLAAIREALGLGPKPGRHATNTDLPAGTGLTRTPTELRLNRRVQSYVVKLGSAAAGDFPDRPEDGWATALAYREHVLRVVERLREDPGAKVQVAEVDGRGRRLRAWVPGDESVRPNVLAAIRGALGHQPQRKPGGPKINMDLPEGSGLSRSRQKLFMCQVISGKSYWIGSAAAGDFPDRPEDGWATALAYREHVLRVVERLREDPGAEVQVAKVDGRARRLRAWAPGDESVRPSVLAAIRGALGLGPKPGRRATNTDLPAGTGLTRTQKELRLSKLVQSDVVSLGSTAGGDFPDSPDDGWATALAYRQHVLRVVERLREDPGAEVQVAAVGKHGRRLRAWAPGDPSVRPKVLAAIRRALTGKEKPC